jgi:hypothetical protein
LVEGLEQESVQESVLVLVMLLVHQLEQEMVQGLAHVLVLGSVQVLVRQLGMERGPELAWELVPRFEVGWLVVV